MAFPDDPESMEREWVGKPAWGAMQEAVARSVSEELNGGEGMEEPWALDVAYMHITWRTNPGHTSWPPDRKRRFPVFQLRKSPGMLEVLCQR